MMQEKFEWNQPAWIKWNFGISFISYTEIKERRLLAAAGLNKNINWFHLKLKAGHSNFIFAEVWIAFSAASGQAFIHSIFFLDLKSMPRFQMPQFAPFFSFFYELLMADERRQQEWINIITVLSYIGWPVLNNNEFGLKLSWNRMNY